MNINLKLKIIEKCGSQAEFSMLVKEDETVISRVIRERRRLATERQKAWAEVLGCSVEDIFKGEAGHA